MHGKQFRERCPYKALCTHSSKFVEVVGVQRQESLIHRGLVGPTLPGTPPHFNPGQT